MKKRQKTPNKAPKKRPQAGWTRGYAARLLAQRYAVR